MLSIFMITLLIVAALICCTFALWMKAKSNSVCGNPALATAGLNVPKPPDIASASVGDHSEIDGRRSLNITWAVTDSNVSVNVEAYGLRPGAYAWGVYGRSVSGFGEACSSELIGPQLFDLSSEFGNLSISVVPASNTGSSLRPRRDPGLKGPQMLHSQLQFTMRPQFTLPSAGSFMLSRKGDRVCSAFNWNNQMLVSDDTADYWGGYCALHWYWMIGGSVFNLISLTTFSLLYGRMARWLTDHENWRTDFEYQNSLILKSMVFEGLNNYFLLFYLTFFKGGVLFGEKNTCVLTRNPAVSDCEVLGEDHVCLVPDCMFEMQIQLMIVFVLKTNGKQIWEFLSPYIFWTISQLFLIRKVTKEQDQANAAGDFGNGAPATGPTVISGLGPPNAAPVRPATTSPRSSASLSEIEKIAAQPRFNGTSNEYLTLMIQFGCIGLFSTALPIAPCLAMISNVIELRGDAYKFTHLVRRPPVTNAEGIGTFATVSIRLNLSAATRCPLPAAVA